jgi:GNAT superfamily N-acetyltransferase
MGFPTDLLSMSRSALRPSAPTTQPPAVAPSYAWVPVRSLAERHRSRILQHLVSLDARDRYLRFGYPASDAQIERYVESLDFDHDMVFGVFNRRLELIAMAHLAMQREVGAPDEGAWAEFGVSVARKARGRGFGRRLFDHAVLHARNRGVDTLLIHALSDNAAMLKIARSAGALVVRDGPESQARLQLPPDNLATHVDEALGQQVAEMDYQFKRQAKRFDEFLKSLYEVKANINKSGNAASQ